MADIVNLRGERKRRQRAERERVAEDNRRKHGIAPVSRAAAAAETERARSVLEAHRRDDPPEKPGR
jgi:hypothetical protein